MRTFHAGIDGGLGEVLPLTLVAYVLVAKRARETHVNLPLGNNLKW